MVQRVSDCIRRFMAVILSLSIILLLPSCNMTPGAGAHDDSGRTYNSDSKKQEGGSTEPSASWTTNETIVPTGTYHEPDDTQEIDINYVLNAYIYSVWYDAVDDNPVDYSDISSEDAFALKGVFYFNTPLTCSFVANLCKDNEILFTKTVTLKNNVTAEADFSAGLEGLGTFEPGDYYVELFFEGEFVSSTSIMTVR